MTLQGLCKDPTKTYKGLTRSLQGPFQDLIRTAPPCPPTPACAPNPPPAGKAGAGAAPANGELWLPTTPGEPPNAVGAPKPTLCGLPKAAPPPRAVGAPKAAIDCPPRGAGAPKAGAAACCPPKPAGAPPKAEACADDCGKGIVHVPNGSQGTPA